MIIFDMNTIVLLFHTLSGIQAVRRKHVLLLQAIPSLFHHHDMLLGRCSPVLEALECGELQYQNPLVP